MQNEYFIVYNPLTFNLMDIYDSCKDPIDILSLLSGLDGKRLNENNFMDYLDFDITKQRQGMVETLAMESYALHYTGNQIAHLKPDSVIILSDGKRRPLGEIIKETGRPAAVFITSMSSNFPTAVATTLALNSGRIPVVIGVWHPINPGAQGFFSRARHPL